MTAPVEDQFTGSLNPRWYVTQTGNASITPVPGALRLTDAPSPDIYTNAQIADYNYQDYDFEWQAPLRMTVTAWAEAPLDRVRGTAGFGFWNHPFAPDTRRLRLPKAIWFFFAPPPNNLALALGVPGHGWKTMTIDAARPVAVALMPLALPAILLMRSPALYERLYPPIQRALAIDDHVLDAALFVERHTYTLDWRVDGATFAVDGAVVFETPHAPRGRLGFVAWIDNQYAVVTPQGTLRNGILPLDHAQTLVLESVQITPLP